MLRAPGVSTFVSLSAADGRSSSVRRQLGIPLIEDPVDHLIAGLLIAHADGWPEGAPVHCRVKMINEFPLIPNFDLLEDMLATVDNSVSRMNKMLAQLRSEGADAKQTLNLTDVVSAEQRIETLG